MPPCSRRTRREFLKTGLAAGTLAMSGALPLAAQRGKATDLVTLGRSGVKVTRLAFGTGQLQRPRAAEALGQNGFTRLVRHAYDSGIRFFETAELVRRDAQDARCCPEGHPTRQLPDHVEGDGPGTGSIRGGSSTSSARSPTRTTSTSCCCTGSTRLPGPPTRRAGRMRSLRSSPARSCSATVRPFTACRPSAGFPATAGSRSR